MKQRRALVTAERTGPQQLDLSTPQCHLPPHTPRHQRISSSPHSDFARAILRRFRLAASRDLYWNPGVSPTPTNGQRWLYPETSDAETDGTPLNVVLDLSFQYSAALHGIFWVERSHGKLWDMPFLMLMALVGRALVWLVFTPPCRVADGGLRCASSWWVRASTTWVPVQPVSSSSFKKGGIQVRYIPNKTTSGHLLLDTGNLVRKKRFCTARWLPPHCLVGCWFFCSGIVSVGHGLRSRATVDRCCLTAFLSSASLSLFGPVEPVSIFSCSSSFPLVFREPLRLHSGHDQDHAQGREELDNPDCSRKILYMSIVPLCFRGAKVCVQTLDWNVVVVNFQRAASVKPEATIERVPVNSQSLSVRGDSPSRPDSSTKRERWQHFLEASLFFSQPSVCCE